MSGLREFLRGLSQQCGITAVPRGERVGGPCQLGPHRAPQGPNEDVDQCPECWSLSYVLRPEGETFGEHLPDCSLPLRHESYCAPGGSGHPPSRLVRGYWPDRGVS